MSFSETPTTPIDGTVENGNATGVSRRAGSMFQSSTSVPEDDSANGGNEGDSIVYLVPSSVCREFPTAASKPSSLDRREVELLVHRYWRSCQETAKKKTLAYRIGKPSTDPRTQIAPVRPNEKVDVSGDVLENPYFYMVVKMESCSIRPLWKLLDERRGFG
jgi:hypothetical protein